MSFSDTASAKKYASISEAAAAQAKLYANQLESAPDYAEQAANAADAAAASAQAAISAEFVINNLAISASESATSAAASAAEAGNAASAAIGQCVRVPEGELIPALPGISERNNSFLVFGSSGDAELLKMDDVPILDGIGKIPVSMIPAIALSEIFVVSSQAAMLDLDVQKGDIAKRTDLGYSFILAAEPASILSNWVQLNDDVLAQLGLSSGASSIGAVDDSGNPSTVQDQLIARVNKAALQSSSGAAGVGAVDASGSSTNVQALLNGKASSSSLSSPYGYNFIGSGSYADIRSYSGTPATSITCYGRATIFDHAYGHFYYDAADTTSPDDDGTVLVDTLGRRWKRIINGEVYPEWWGAVADNITDCSPAFQKAFDYCSGKNLPTTGTGLKLRIRGGRYILASTVHYTWRYDQGIVDDGDMRRLSIEGDGTCNTYLIYTGVQTSPAIHIHGGNGNGIYLRMNVQGFRLFRSLSLTRYLGTGILLERGAVFTFSHVDVGYFNTGLNMQDALYATFDTCDLSGNNQGVSMSIVSASSPNSVLFSRCMFGGCQVRGAYIKNGANVKFDSCTFEATGTDGTNEAILYEGGPHEGGLGMTVSNCYFENNFTLYDINIANNSTYPGTFLLSGNSHNRTSSTRYTTSASINLYSASQTTKVTIQSCGFKGFGSYVASSSRPAYIVQSQYVSVHEINNFYMYPEEYPNLNGFAATGFGLGATGACANISSAGVINRNFNIQSVTITSTGVYSVTFKKPLTVTPVGTVSISNGIGFATVSTISTTGMTVNTYDVSGTAAAKSFDLSVSGSIA
ncbi:hypothetical protein E7W35_12655 [Cronobacter sakazakii]|uniref:right-handed parallel beta-helix repeat-containing protein n=1 Tax=Cronobacter sakazakii TaxID=28141 RepID=UPI001F50B548|nr:right-handed parallel beta-helix repeat-containing protein [Cronobacter sakazakii]MCI0311931.1 hypothetical protein [Cronobacter sakazakii]